MTRTLSLSPVSAVLLAFAACIAISAVLDGGERPTAAVAAAFLALLIGWRLASERHAALAPAASIGLTALALASMLGGAPIAALLLASAAGVFWAPGFRLLAAPLAAIALLIALDLRAISPAMPLLALFPLLINAFAMIMWRRKRGQALFGARGDHPVDVAARVGVSESNIGMAYAAIAIHCALIGVAADVIARGAAASPEARIVMHLPAIAMLAHYAMGLIVMERVRAYAEARGVAQD